MQKLRLVTAERPRCESCGSLEVMTAGRRLRPGVGELVQNYRCRRCGTNFTPDIYRMGKTPRAVVDLAVSMARKGIPIEQIVRQLPRLTGKSAVNTTVRKWISKHAPELSWRQGDSSPDKQLAEEIRKEPYRPRVPIFGLPDLESGRRVLLDRETRTRAQSLIRGKYSAYSDVYHSFYSNKWSKDGLWAPSARLYRRVAKSLHMSQAKAESHVLAVLTGKSGRSKQVAGPFPVKANGGFAFLLGLFYASGGIGSACLHFAVDRQVGEYMRKEISREVREVPVIISQGKKPHGSFSVTYGGTMLAILKKFGLKVVDPVQLGTGKYVPSRYMTLGVPYWVRREPFFLHRFIEGYVNGLKLSVGLEGRLDGRPRRRGAPSYPYTYCTAKISFCCRDPRELEFFTRVVVKHLRALGAKPGYLNRTRMDGRKMQHMSYSWHTLAGLRNFRDNFRVVRPQARLKLGLRLSKDLAIHHALNRTRGLDNYVLGMLTEGPKTRRELVEGCPRRPYNMSTWELLRPSVERLSRMKIVRLKGNEWTYDPSRFVRDVADAYRRRLERKQRLRSKIKKDIMYDVSAFRRLWDPRAEQNLQQLVPLVEVRR